MALIEITPNPTSQTRQLIRDGIQGWFNFTRACYDNIQNLIWENPFGLTPQQAFDSLGIDATELLVYAGEIEALFARRAPEGGELVSKRPEGVTITPNQDGTVTVS